jgi:hypothetical protein
MREAIHTFKIVEFQQFKIRLTLSTTSGFNSNVGMKRLAAKNHGYKAPRGVLLFSILVDCLCCHDDLFEKKALRCD